MGLILLPPWAKSQTCLCMLLWSCLFPVGV